MSNRRLSDVDIRTQPSPMLAFRHQSSAVSCTTLVPARHRSLSPPPSVSSHALSAETLFTTYQPSGAATEWAGEWAIDDPNRPYFFCSTSAQIYDEDRDFQQYSCVGDGRCPFGLHLPAAGVRVDSNTVRRIFSMIFYEQRLTSINRTRASTSLGTARAREFFIRRTTACWANLCRIPPIVCSTQSHISTRMSTCVAAMPSPNRCFPATLPS